MKNQDRNKAFLAIIPKETKNKIISSIANHYATNHETIINELTNNDDAENILEYMSDIELREKTSNLMLQHNLRGF